MTSLVLGPSLGTSADACWGPCASLLRSEFDVVAWELPGHGSDRGRVPESVTVENLALQVLNQVDGPFIYAGDSVGGQVGLELCLASPDRVRAAVLCCTGAKIGDQEMWDARIAQVRASGTSSLITATTTRWFAAGFLERAPARASALLHALRDTSDAGYVAVCQAVAAYDACHRLAEIATPIVAVAGVEDPVCTTDDLRAIAEGVQHGRLITLNTVAHQAPAEAPVQVAKTIRDLAMEVA